MKSFFRNLTVGKSIFLIFRNIVWISVVWIVFLRLPSYSREVNSQPLLKLEGNLLIESDIQSRDSVSGVITAIGNVKINYPDKGLFARSKQAQYFSSEEIVVLTGEVDVVRKDGSSIHTDRLVYRLKEDKLISDSTPGTKVISKIL